MMISDFGGTGGTSTSTPTSTNPPNYPPTPKSDSIIGGYPLLSSVLFPYKTFSTKGILNTNNQSPLHSNPPLGPGPGVTTTTWGDSSSSSGYQHYCNNVGPPGGFDSSFPFLVNNNNNNNNKGGLITTMDMMEGEEEDQDTSTDKQQQQGDGRPLSERNGKHHKSITLLSPNSSSSSMPSPSSVSDKVCGVCGDKALGNNFNAVTCESCKAFFRRNALRKKDFVCPFSDNCKVDAITRRFCQKCRLKKCFDIGMKKEWIMTDEEKKLKKQKIEQNRLKRSTGGGEGESSCSSLPPTKRDKPCPSASASDSSTNSNDVCLYPPTPTPTAATPLKGPSSISSVSGTIDQIVAAASVLQAQEEQEEELLEANGSSHPILASLVRPAGAESPPELIQQPSEYHEYPSRKNMIAQYKMEKLTKPLVPSTLQGPPPPPPSAPQFEPILPLNTMESILSVAISAEFNGFGMLRDSQPSSPASPSSSSGGSMVTPTSSSSSTSSLNKAEKSRLTELFYACEALDAPVDQDGPIKIETSDPSLINVINLTDIAIRRLIKMAKKIGAFKSMCQEDQIALLKGGCTEMMILRSVVSYDPERDSWNIPHSNGFNVKLGVLKEARGNLYEEHQRFVKSFRQEWRSDYNIMIILCAITLFTPERPNVIHKDVVKLEQDSYYYLLKRYLESTRNGCEARSTYLQLIQRIAELHILNQNHLRVFLEVNPTEVEPLLIEIFDLKQ